MSARACLLPILLLVASPWLLQAGGAQDPPARQAPVLVFLLRHAEAATASATPRDPELSPAGAARAKALARLLGDAGATHLWASQLQRTQATLTPLAAVTGVGVGVIEAQDAEAQLAALRALPAGAVAVVCGHSNTIPALVEGLGGSVAGLESDPRNGRTLHHDSYDRLFLVTLPRTAQAAVRSVELRYGE
ncbi:MAG TPA: histidine phosphatase family protein [Planctomycetota bacterium]